MTHTDLHPTLEDLRSVPVFADLPSEGLAWMAEQMNLVEFEEGEVLFHTGDPAEHLIIFFEGELRAEREDGRVFIAPAGQVTGLLPYSRLTHFASNVRASLKSRGAFLHKSHFTEMLERMPVLHERLVGVLSDRVRETATVEQQREKLMALGKIAAGLAHELNNPASAARRATDNLRTAMHSLRSAGLALDKHGFPGAARLFLAQLEFDWAQSAGPPSVLDTLERSEREEEFADWLDARKIQNIWELSSAFVDAGCSVDTLNEVAAQVPAEFLNDALARLAASFTTTRLLDEIENSIGRVSELVRAVKEYSYMDQAPKQEIDIHPGIENTLIMLRHRLKEGVTIVREYDHQLPKINVHGSELNQVWTNLIGNAIDAIKGKGKLKIRTSRDTTHLIVEITDDGPGIPPDIRTRIFEPFFTTKPIGEGTGLGLDVSRRIIKNHSGSISFESRPGETRFIVKLPLDKRC